MQNTKMRKIMEAIAVGSMAVVLMVAAAGQPKNPSTGYRLTISYLDKDGNQLCEPYVRDINGGVQAETSTADTPQSEPEGIEHKLTVKFVDPDGNEIEQVTSYHEGGEVYKTPAPKLGIEGYHFRQL